MSIASESGGTSASGSVFSQGGTEQGRNDIQERNSTTTPPSRISSLSSESQDGDELKSNRHSSNGEPSSPPGGPVERTGESKQEHVGNPYPSSPLSNNPNESDDETPVLELLQYKIVILGDGAVGKSSIINRLCCNDYSRQYKQTLGLDLFKKRVDLPGGVRASLQIWDVGGQTIGSRMIDNYVYAAQAVLLVYDVTNANSFANLDEWLGVVQRVFGKDELPYIGLVANKMDLTHMRAVKQDKHQRFATENNTFSFYISARLGDQVTLMFRQVAADLAGLTLSKSELEVGRTITPARIVNHPQHDPGQRPINLNANNNSVTCTSV